MKVTTYIKNAMNKVLAVGKTPKNYRWANVLLWAYACLFILYLFGWGWNWWFSGVATLSDLIALGTLMVSPAAMATLLAFLKLNTDSNHNKIPDFLEDNNESNRRERVEGVSKPGTGSRRD